VEKCRDDKNLMVDVRNDWKTFCQRNKGPIDVLPVVLVQQGKPGSSICVTLGHEK